MVIWQITGNEIGPNGNGAAYFATQAEAWKALREHRDLEGDECKEEATATSDGPFKITVKNRAELCRELNAAMGYGAS